MGSGGPAVELAEAFGRAMAGVDEVIRAWHARVVEAFTVEPLSAAERGVLMMLTTHLTVPQIAVLRGVSRATVRSQVASVYRKLGVSSRDGAVRRGRELGLIDG